jgi:protein transport protein SEC61 subunit gamma-like protein
MADFKKTFEQCKRVFKITRKPTKVEFKRIVQVTGLGIVIIGLIGFAILMLYEVIF